MKKITPEEIEKQYAYMSEATALLSDRPDRRYFIRTFGCQQNEADSEKLAGMCETMGYRQTESEKDADLILVNTCAVREHAELRALSITGQFKHLKEKNPSLIIGICGCMVSQEHRMKAIKNSYPYVDFLFGTGMLHRFPELLVSHLKGGKRQFCLDDTEGNLAEGLPIARSSNIKAYVSIMYGCNNFCSYCVVPHVRGRERSRSREDVLREVKDLIANGCKEITLLGQNVNSYRPEDGDGYDFADLVKEISELDGEFILRFMSSHPKDASSKLIDVMASHEKCARQFHLPLQSGSERVLKEMNRRYTPERYLSLIDEMREKMPDITVSSDLIVGFPGETDEEFEETLAMLKQVRFDMIYSFIYSPRELTPAAKLDCQIPADVKSARMTRLLDLQNQISYEKNLDEVGKIRRVLLEGVSKNDETMLSGRADSNKLVHIPRCPASEEKIGSFVSAKITGAEPFALFGELN